MYKRVPQLRVLICGGDGTVGWVLSTLDQVIFFLLPSIHFLFYIGSISIWIQFYDNLCDIIHFSFIVFHSLFHSFFHLLRSFYSWHGQIIHLLLSCHMVLVTILLGTLFWSFILLLGIIIFPPFLSYLFQKKFFAIKIYPLLFRWTIPDNIYFIIFP